MYGNNLAGPNALLRQFRVERARHVAQFCISNRDVRLGREQERRIGLRSCLAVDGFAQRPHDAGYAPCFRR
jgi:hypothetical protein